MNIAIKYFKFLDLIQRKGYTKSEFAELAGFSSATMAKLSSHKPVSMEVINRICFALDCQPADIMEYIPDTKKADE